MHKYVNLCGQFHIDKLRFWNLLNTRVNSSYFHYLWLRNLHNSCYFFHHYDFHRDLNWQQCFNFHLFLDDLFQIYCFNFNCLDWDLNIDEPFDFNGYLDGDLFDNLYYLLFLNYPLFFYWDFLDYLYLSDDFLYDRLLGDYPLDIDLCGNLYHCKRSLVNLFFRLIEHDFHRYFNRHDPIYFSINKNLIRYINQNYLCPNYLSNSFNIHRSFYHNLLDNYLFFNYRYLSQFFNLEEYLNRNLDRNQYFFFNYNWNLQYNLFFLFVV